MNKILGLVALSMMTPIFAMAAPATFLCKTKLENDGYYTKQEMRVRINQDQKTVFVQPHDVDSGDWSYGSNGKFSKVNAKNQFSAFTGFESEGLFGDLSEGVAHDIRFYISPAVMAGKPGVVILYAAGWEVGLENATYQCVRIAK